MALTLTNLDSETRSFITQEILADIAAGKLYISARLSPSGVQSYPEILKLAAEQHDDTWFAAQLQGKFNATENRNVKGKIISASVPVNAHEMLAEGEFNRFYLRGLCLRAIQNNIPHLVIYRAKAVSNPRAESEAKIGTTINPASLLADLCNNIGIDTALGLPAGPNSGLSAKLP
ncbi:hypothetical protein [Geobacter anodireducens]|uniref:Uncharacterized protein n=1 Tax=Geobacter anodireducens TaxID=1340425 RepID=A0ABR9NSX7_9BACT|nr:hypothetical protein [Geobacter anodireducens]MBE2887367.1 hypothetical protein [Geobacter anodireducens]